jgi:tetratricopeptide (TPR) repeat protein
MNDDTVTHSADDLQARRVDEFRDNPSAAAYAELRADLRNQGRGDLLVELCSFWAAREPNPKQAAEAWSEAGEVLFVMGMMDPALDRLRRALELDPVNDRAVDRLVDTLLARDDVAAAVEPIEAELGELARRAGDARPKKGDPIVARRAAQHRRAAKLWNDYLGRVDRALQHWQQAWRLEPQRTDALEEARNLYASLGDDGMVGKLYKAELDVLGGSGSAERRACIHYELGRIAMRGKDYAEASRQLEEAVRLEPTSHQIRETLAEAYALSGRGADAARKASDIFVELGKHRLERDDATGIQLLRRAVGVDPSSASGSKALEQALTTARRWADLDRLLQERLLNGVDGKERASLLARRAELYRGPLANPAALIGVLGELAALEGPRGAASAELRGLLTGAQDYPALAQLLEAQLAALMADPKARPEAIVAELLELATISREHLNDRDRAAELLHQALTVMPGHDEALARYMDHFRERRDWRGLLDLLEFALDNARAQDASGEELAQRLEEIAQIAELRLGDIPRAIDAWQRIAEVAPGSAKVSEALRRLTARSKMWEQLVSTLEAEVASAPSDDTRIEAMRRMAVTYRERQIEPRRAIEVYEQILANHPSDEAALKALVELYEREGDDAGVAQTLRRQLDAEAQRISDQMAASGKPADAAREWPVQKRAERLTALRRLAQLCETRLADVDGVVFGCSGVLELLPGDRDALERMERVLERAGDGRLEQTLEYHASVAASPAERAKILRRLARLSQAAGEELTALDRWEQALRASPTDPEALTALAELYERNERWSLLAQILERLDGGRQLPERGTAEAAVRVGELERYAEIVDGRLHDVPRAVRAWQRIVELSPKHPAALGALTRIYRETGKWRELAAVLEKQVPVFAVTDPARATAAALEHAELLEHKLGSPEDAIRALESLIRDLNPNHAGAHTALRRLHETRGDFEASVKIAEREMYLAAEPAQKIGVGLEIGAACRDRLGNPTRALQAFERVLGIDDKEPTALAAAADLYARLGRHREEVRALERLLPAVTDGDERRDLLHRIAHVTAEHLGDTRGAFRWWKAAHQEAPDQGSFTDVRRAAEQYGLWKELAEAYAEERRRLGGDGGAADAAAFVRLSRELAQVVERRLGDRMRAMMVLVEAFTAAPRDGELLVELERLAVEGDVKPQWKMLLDAYDVAAGAAGVAERVSLLLKRAEVLDERMGDPKGAVAELLSAFSWEPEREETRARLHELSGRARTWAELVSVESALAERAAAPAARVEALRRKAQLIEEHLKDAPRAFRTHLVAFLVDPDNADTGSHLWRLARVIGKYREADRSPRPEPASAVIHSEQVLAEINGATNAAGEGSRPRKQARMMTEELSDADLGTLASLDIAPAVNLRVGDETQPIDLAELELSEGESRSGRGEAEGPRRGARPLFGDGLKPAALDTGTHTAIDAGKPNHDRTMELSISDLSIAPRGGGSSSPSPMPGIPESTLFGPQASSARSASAASKLPPPPPRPPQIRPGKAAAPPPSPRKAQAQVRKAPLPSLPGGSFESPWEELALAYEGLPAHDDAARLRWLYRAAEIWEAGGKDLSRAFETLSRAFSIARRPRRAGESKLVDGDAEVRARLHRLANEHGAWDRLAALYEAAGEEAESAAEAGELLMEVAKIRAEQKRPRDAEAQLRRVLGMRPDDVAARAQLEELYRQEGRWVELAAALEERTDPRLGTAAPELERAQLLRELSSLYTERLSHPHDAIDTLERLRVLEPADLAVLFSLADLYGAVGRWSKAIETLGRVVEVAEPGGDATNGGHSEGRDALRRIAAIYEAELELPDRAIDAYRQLVTSWPDDLPAWAALDALYTQNARWTELADVIRRRAGLSREPAERAQLLSRRAQILLDWLDSAEEAAAALRHARTISPDDPALAEQLVTALVRADRGREAAAILEGRIEALADQGAARGDLAALYIRLAQLKLEKLADVAGARDALDAALGLVPEHPTALTLYTQLASPDDDPQAYADAKLREADGTRDDDVRIEALMVAGQVLRDRVQDVAGARSAFERVLAQRPYDSEATWALAGLVEKGGDPETAARLLENRLGTGELPVAEKARILTQLAALSRAAGVEPAAERRLLEALAAVPDHLPAVVALADFYADRERWEDLESFLREVLGEGGGEGAVAGTANAALTEAPPALTADLQRRLASAFEKLGRDEEAYQTLLAADRLHRGHLLIKLALGENRYKARRWREAALHLAPLATHEEAARYPQEVAQGLYHAALAEIRSLRPEKAQPLYHKALELKPNFAPALQALAEVAMEQGDYRQASDLLTRQAAATDEPSEKMRLYEALGDMALMMMNDEERARACFASAVAAASPLEARHVPLLEKLLARQDRTGDRAGAAKTSELMAAFGANASERSARYLRAAHGYRAAGDLVRARAAADRAVDSEPYDLAAADLASQLALAADDTHAAAELLGRCLSSKDERDPVLRAKLAARLGAARAVRGDVKRARQALERAVALAPDSEGATAARRTLVEILRGEDAAAGDGEGEAKVARRQAIQELSRSVAHATGELADLVEWAGELRRADAGELGREAFEVAIGLGHVADVHQAAFLSVHKPQAMRADEPYKSSLRAADHAMFGAPGSLAPLGIALHEAASQLWPELGEVLGRVGLTAQHRIAATSHADAVAMWPRLTTAVGAGASVLYQRDDASGPDVEILCGGSTLVVLGPRLTGQLPPPPPAELRAILSRAAALTRPEHLVFAGLPSPELARLVAACARLFGPAPLRQAAQRFVIDADVQRAYEDMIRGVLTVKLRARIEEALAAPGLAELDLAGTIEASQRSADGAALALGTDLTAVVRVVSGRGSAATHLVKLLAHPGWAATRQRLRRG